MRMSSEVRSKHERSNSSRIADVVSTDPNGGALRKREILRRRYRHNHVRILVVTRREFLDAFRSLGCYLVDLCGEPVDHLPRSKRTILCRAGEARLARRIRTFHPMVIVTLVRSIRTSVERAQKSAGWTGLHLELPYPGRWKRHRIEFQRQLMPVLLKTLAQRSHEVRLS